VRVFSHSCSLYILLDHFLGVAAKAINTRKKCGKQSTNSGERTIPRRKILPHVGRGTYTCTYVHSFPRLETLGFPILRQSSRRGTSVHSMPSSENEYIHYLRPTNFTSRVWIRSTHSKRRNQQDGSVSVLCVCSYVKNHR